MGIVPAGTVSTDSHCTYKPWAMDGTTFTTYVDPLAWKLTFVTSLAIPYNGLVSSDIITFSPPMGDTMTLTSGRIYSGKLKVSSDTVTISATTLNGTLHGAAISDLRDVLLGSVNASTNVVTGGAFTASSIAQAGCTLKDALKDVSLARGITCVVGPDIKPTLQSCSYQNSFNYNGQISSPFPLNVTIASPSNMVSGASYVHWVGWVSPWNVQDTSTSYYRMGGASMPIAVQNINWLNSVNPVGGCFDIEVQITFRLNAVMTTAMLETVTAEFTHLYATVSSDGAIYYQQASEICIMLPAIAGCDASVQNKLPATARGHPKQYMSGAFNQTAGYAPATFAGFPYGSVGCGGMYLGSHIKVISRNMSRIDAYLVHYMDTGTFPPCVLLQSVSNRDVDEYGPARVIRYEGLSAGQTLRVDGTFFAECVPGITTIPFVQSAGNMSRVCTNLNAMSFMSFAYNSDESPFKRIWESDELADFVKHDLTCFDEKKLRSFASPRLISAAIAAGIVPHEYEGMIEVNNSHQPLMLKQQSADTMSMKSVKRGRQDEDDASPPSPRSVFRGKYNPKIPAQSDVAGRLQELDKTLEKYAEIDMRRRSKQ